MNTRIAIAVLAFVSLLLVPRAAVTAAESPDTQAPRTFDVRWEPAPFPVFQDAELPNPWSIRTPDDPAPRWQVYEASIDNAPRLVHETQRLPGDAEWDKDGKAIRLGVVSQGAPKSPCCPPTCEGKSCEVKYVSTWQRVQPRRRCSTALCRMRYPMDAA